MLKPLTSFLSGLIVAPVAHSYCYEPSFGDTPPDPPSSYERPDVPYCLEEYSWSGRHTCDDWEIDAYFSDVEDYAEELEDYLYEVEAFKMAAERFASEAVDYATCEADEVVSQHE